MDMVEEWLFLNVSIYHNAFSLVDYLNVFFFVIFFKRNAQEKNLFNGVITSICLNLNHFLSLNLLREINKLKWLNIPILSPILRLDCGRLDHFYLDTGGLRCYLRMNILGWPSRSPKSIYLVTRFGTHVVYRGERI